MRVFMMCSGTGNRDRAFERKSWDVVNVDWLANFRSILCADIIKWDYRAAFSKDHF